MKKLSEIVEQAQTWANSKKSEAVEEITKKTILNAIDEDPQKAIAVAAGILTVSVVAAYLIGHGVGERRAYRSVVTCATKMAEAKL